MPDPVTTAELHRRFRQAILTFEEDSIGDLTREALDAGMTPQEIIITGLAPGLEEIGIQYSQGECFIPELVMAGNTMKEAMAVLDPIIEAQGAGQRMGIVVIGTVAGDLHDIGKNLVVSMLRGSGFQIYDLGVNVPTMQFVEAVRVYKPDVLALSALLLTTRTVMADVINALARAGLRDQVKVIVGGAPITQGFAEQIDADGFGEDAVAAVQLTRRFTGH